MTISIKADASGNSGSIQVAGVDRLTLNTDGSLVAGANPATGNRSMALATMQMFADEFGASLSANGYQKLPSGLIIQWGVSGNITAQAGVNITFPIAFPNACRSVTANLNAVSTNIGDSIRVGSVTASGCNLGRATTTAGDAAHPAFWTAIGH